MWYAKLPFCRFDGNAKGVTEFLSREIIIYKNRCNRPEESPRSVKVTNPQRNRGLFGLPEGLKENAVFYSRIVSERKTSEILSCKISPVYSVSRLKNTTYWNCILLYSFIQVYPLHISLMSNTLYRNAIDLNFYFYHNKNLLPDLRLYFIRTKVHKKI